MAQPHRTPRPDLPEDAAELGPPGDPETVARTICLRQLDRRACTRTELRELLRKRGVPDDAAERVLARFVEVGLINDAALADGYAATQHRERGLAGRAVATKLRRRGVDEEIVQAAVDQIDAQSELETARELVRRRLKSLGGLDAQVQARRLVGLLARKGYPPGVAYQVVRQCLAGVPDELFPSDS